MRIARTLFVLMLIAIVTMHFLPTVQAYTGNYDVFQRMTPFLADTQYEVPEEHRVPTLSMVDFYKFRQQRLTEQLIETRKRFPNQHVDGSVFTDGFHNTLPEGAAWRKHKVVLKQ